MLNLARVADASQTLAVASAEQCLAVFLRLLIQETDAHHGVLLLPNDSGWTLAAVATVAPDAAESGAVSLSLPFVEATAADLPLATVQQVAESGAPLLSRVRADNSKTTAVGNAGWSLCVPLLRQQVVGVVYLAHPQARFTLDHLRFTTILGAQVSWALGAAASPYNCLNRDCLNERQQPQVNADAASWLEVQAEQPTSSCALAELSPVGLFRHDEQGHCLYLNAKAKQLLAFPPQPTHQGWLTVLAMAKTVAEPVTATIPEELTEDSSAPHSALVPWRRFVQSARQQLQSTYRDEIAVPCAPGRWRWLLVQAEVERTPSGAVSGFSGALIDISDRKQTEETLRTSEARFRQVFDATLQFVGIFTPEGRVIQTNQPPLEFAGLSMQAVVQTLIWETPWFEGLPESRERVRQAVTRAAAGELVQFEMAVRGQHGEVLIMDASCNPLRDSTGTICGVLGEARDITALKQTEAALRQREAELAESQRIANIGSWEFDPATQTCRWSVGMSYITGQYPNQGEISVVELEQSVFHLDDLAELNAAVERAVRDAVPYAVEHRIWHADGSVRYVISRGEAVFDAAGQVIKLFGTVQDITDRKQIELALQESEAQFRQLAETLDDVFWIYDPQIAEFTYVSPAYETIWGQPFRHSDRVNWLESVHPQDRQRVRQAIDDCLTGINQDLEYQIVRSDGSVRWVRDRFYAVDDDSGRVLRLVGIAEDITSRKQLEAAMQDTEVWLQLTLNLTHIAAWRWKPGQMIYCNANGARLIGLSPTPAVPYETWRNALHPEDRDRVEQALLQAIATQTEYECEYRVIWPDGTMRWLEGKGRGLHDQHGQFVEMLGIVIDITDRKQTELALRDSELRYWEIVEQQTELVCRYLPDSTLTFVNEAYCRYFGRSRQELVGTPFLPLIPAADQPYVAALLATLGTSLEPFHSEHSVLRDDGEIRWLQWTDKTIRDDQGNLLEVQCVGRDITERKQAELALRESEERFRSLVETSSDWVWEVNEQGVYTYASPRSQDILGYMPAEILGKTPFDLMPPAEARRISEMFSVLAAQRQPFSCLENLCQHKQGYLVTLETSAMPIIDANGQFRGYRGIDRDITEHKQTEVSLQSLVSATAGVTGADFFPALVRHLALALGVDFALITRYNCNQFRTLAFWADGALQPNLSYAAADALACRWVVQHGTLSCESGVQNRFGAEGQIIRQLGAESYLGVALVNSQGETLGTLCILDRQPLVHSSRLITLLHIFAARAAAEIERQQAIDALQASELRLRQIANAVPGMVYQYIALPTGEERFSFVSQGIIDLYGLTPEQAQADVTAVESRIVSEDRAQLRSYMAEIKADTAESLKFWHQEYRVIQPNGSIKWVSGRSLPTRLDDGSIIWHGVVIDITERKRLEAELHRTNAELQAIFDAFPDFFFRLDAEGRILDYRAGCQSQPQLYATPEQFLGRPLPRVLPPALGDRVETAIRQTLATGAIVSLEYELPLLDESHTEPQVEQHFEARFVRLASQQVVVTVRNIADRKQAEIALHQMNQQLEQRVIERTQKLQQSEQRFRNLFDAMPRIAVQGYNRQRQVIYWNRASEVIYGYSAPEALGQPLEDLIIPPHLRESVVADINEWLATGVPIPSGELELIDKHGNVVIVYSSHVMLTGAEGEPELYCVDIDLRDRKQAEAALRESEERFRQLAETVESVFWMTDTAEQLLYVSPAFERIWGFPVPRLMESPEIWVNALHPEDRERILALRPTQIYGNYEQEYRIFRPDGEICWIRDRAFPIRNAEGEVYRIVGIAEDVTAFRLAEQALQESRQFAQSIADSTPDIVYIHDLVEHRNVYSNRDMLEVIGYTMADIAANGLERMLALVLHPDDLVSYIQHQQRLCAAADGDILEIEYRYRHADGSWHWFYSRDTVFKRDAQGQVTQYIGTAQDITERKRLQEEQARLLKILESAPDYIGMATPEGKTLWLNAQMKQLYNLSDGADLSQFQIADVHPEWASVKILTEGIPQAAQQGMWLGETALLAPHGEEIPVSQLILRHTAADGEVEYLSTIMRDISERKRTEAALQQAYLELEARVEERTAELKQAKEAAEAASRAKTTFLTHMSHELRTPLNAILGFTQLMHRSPELNPEQQQHLAIINRNGEHLLSLINDILEMSKIEAGRATLNPNNFDLYRLLTTVEDMFRLKAEVKHLQLHLDCPPEVPQFIRTDEGKLRQVLINLLGNAVKFTAAGRVSLRVRCSDSPPLDFLLPPPLLASPDPSTVWLWFEVEDTGPGIAPEELDRLFEPFGQTETGRQSQEGTGLGLPISREFVQLMGGDLTVTSVVRQGSCFRFSIQTTRIEPPALQAQPRVIGVASHQRYRLLVVEDNWANRQLLMQLFSLLGFEVHDAQNGRDAIERWREWQPDLIWMDIRMPEMDGYEATRRIRAESAAQPQGRRAPIIIALTASAFEEDRMAILSAGCDDFVRKPVAEQTLLEKMAHHLGVQYLYESEVLSPELSSNQPPAPELLTPEQLHIMPTAWIHNLRHAAQIADEELMLQLLDQIPPDHAELAATLRRLIHNFCLDQLLAVTASAAEPPSTQS